MIFKTLSLQRTHVKAIALGVDGPLFISSNSFNHICDNRSLSFLSFNNISMELIHYKIIRSELTGHAECFRPALQTQKHFMKRNHCLLLLGCPPHSAVQDVSHLSS